MRQTPRRVGLWVFGAGGVAASLIVIASVIVLAPLRSAEQRSGRVGRDDLVIQRRSTVLRGTLVQFQSFLEPRFDAYQAGGSFAPDEIARASELTKAQIREADALVAALRSRGISAPANDLDEAVSTFTASVTDLTPVASGERLSDRRFALLVSSERAAFTRVWEVTSNVNQDVSAHTTTPDVNDVTDQIRRARTLIFVCAGILVLLALAVALYAARRAARRQRRHDEETRRRHYATELYQAVDLSTTEEAVYDVVARTLRETVPSLDVELLIADSSHAHFQRAFTSHPDGRSGCGVVSPGDCPAAVRGHTMRFASSEAISACPYLRDRPTGPCSAVCIPVSIAGSTVGVMHAVGSDGVLPKGADVESMELSARHGSERIALLRAFANSETQAHTDPLTGLLNRRSLENQVRELQRGGTPYALAYGDLDHFKVLNDTHGHEAGDRALRLFARVLRDSVRPSDLVSRYGGEEFIVVLPECDIERATSVLERVRESLALALTHGSVPAFTVSFGLAGADDGSTFAELTARADEALLAAKVAGRNRVLVAGEPLAAAAQRSGATPNSIVST
jgi:diguanylate cyclase (GGDEF)-like protein